MRRFVQLTISLLLLIAFKSAFSQHDHSKCGTPFDRSFRELESLRGIPGYFGCNAIERVDVKLQISLHIVQDRFGMTGVADDDIIGAQDRLNLLWAPIGMSFEICRINLIENYQWDSLTVFTDYNEESQMTSIHYFPNTINVYLCDTIVKEDLGQVGGYAYFPGGPDVIVCDKTNFNFDDVVMPHEMGHFFGLYHTFETDLGIELADGSNCETAGDLVCDTEADPDEDGNADPDIECNYTGTVTQDSNGDWYVPPTDNIMSYYPSECLCRFTPQQYNRMAEQYRTIRFYLW